jgi:hypothetical protein
MSHLRTELAEVERQYQIALDEGSDMLLSSAQQHRALKRARALREKRNRLRAKLRQAEAAPDPRRRKEYTQ